MEKHRPFLRRLAKGGSIAACVCTLVLCHGAMLPTLLKVLSHNDLAATALDTPTHYFRMLQARDFYLASGHRLGWEPFWFQGYVPFLLYPHLPYVVLALVSKLLSFEPQTTFNYYIVGVYLALPAIAGVLTLRSHGLVPALLAICWFSFISAFGAGGKNVFQIGLLSQQLGVILFLCFAHFVVVRRRIDVAAIFLGLIPLVHVHTSIIAGVVWIAVGILAAAEATKDSSSLKSWTIGSLFAALMSAPTSLALFQGWGDVGGSTTYKPTDDFVHWLISGRLFAPFPMVVAIFACIAFTARLRRAGTRRHFFACCLVGILLVVASTTRIDSDVTFANRIVNTMLYLRTLAFAFTWLALLALSRWSFLSYRLRYAVVALSLAGVVAGWPSQVALATKIDLSLRHGSRTDTAKSFSMAMKWIAADHGGIISTIATCLPKGPTARFFVTAVERTGLPLLTGHGVELTSIHNSQLANWPTNMTCDAIHRQIRDYGVGYIVGTKLEQRDHFERCLDTSPDFDNGQWWVFKTHGNWISPSTRNFSHDVTWTELTWDLKPVSKMTTLRLPVANNGRWRAEADEMAVPITSTNDGMMRVSLRPNSEQLRLIYMGYAAEWESVIIAAIAGTLACIRLRRTDRDHHLGK